jgi:hypothetical protein
MNRHIQNCHPRPTACGGGRVDGWMNLEWRVERNAATSTTQNLIQPLTIASAARMDTIHSELTTSLASPSWLKLTIGHQSGYVLGPPPPKPTCKWIARPLQRFASYFLASVSGHSCCLLFLCPSTSPAAKNVFSLLSHVPRGSKESDRTTLAGSARQHNVCSAPLSLRTSQSRHVWSVNG